MTTSSLGLSFLILTMNLSIYSILGSIIGVKLNNIQIKQSSKNAAYCTFITTFISKKSFEISFKTILLKKRGGKIFRINFNKNFDTFIIQK